MDRRRFIWYFILAVPTLRYSLLSTPAKAAVDPATIAATAQVASAVLSYMSRGSDPTVELIISITKMLEAVGKKLDAIDQKIDILSDQIAEVRSLLTQTPKLTLQHLLLSNLREPWSSFIQAYKQRSLFNSPSSYLAKLTEIYGRQQEARTKFLNFSQSSKYDGLVSVALAYDAETTMVVEMLRVAAASNLIERVEPALLRAALLDYIDYFSTATLETTTDGPAFLLAEAKRNVENVLKAPIEIQEKRKTSSWDEEASISVPIFKILESKQLKATCGFTGDLCLKSGQGKSGCAEPGERRYLNAIINIKSETIADIALLPLDELKQPFLHRLASDYMCENGLKEESAIKATIEKALPFLEKVNQHTISYYNLMHLVQVGIFARDSARAALKEFDEIYRS